MKYEFLFLFSSHSTRNIMYDENGIFAIKYSFCVRTIMLKREPFTLFFIFILFFFLFFFGRYNLSISHFFIGIFFILPGLSLFGPDFHLPHSRYMCSFFYSFLVLPTILSSPAFSFSLPHTSPLPFSLSHSIE